MAPNIIEASRIAEQEFMIKEDLCKSQERLKKLIFKNKSL